MAGQRTEQDEARTRLSILREPARVGHELARLPRTEGGSRMASDQERATAPRRCDAFVRTKGVVEMRSQSRARVEDRGVIQDRIAGAWLSILLWPSCNGIDLASCEGAARRGA